MKRSLNLSNSKVRFYSTTPNKTTFKDFKDITAASFGEAACNK